MPTALPAHLRRYVVEQDYSRYTPIDQEIWRHIMRQLKSFLPEHAHPCYAEGLRKTGIEVDRIPDIARMSEKLEAFGWRAVPVSGFIPPAAFMELQSLGFLPIACDLRTIDHLMYTPAPDIVHEAAGHAPILVDPAFASYLKAYAQVARKAIISREDLDQYEAIRALSDLKEDPSSTPEQIRLAENRLTQVTQNLTHLSEAALLGRMNWWTAEYGLIGTLENPKIFGAGLLSSVGEARECLGPKVKKLPFTIDCIEYSYDITEPQPQLFVTPDFDTLESVLEELAERMAFRIGGVEGLRRAHLAATVNTVQLNSGLQISGRLKNYLIDDGAPVYLQFEGPTQLCAHETQLSGHGASTHAEGFGSPVGLLAGTAKCLSEMTEIELRQLGIATGQRAHLKFASGSSGNGVEVRGEVVSFTREARNGRLMIISFKDCSVRKGDQLLFDPGWGCYDMAVGERVTSVFGGPADRAAYGATDSFVAKTIPKKQHSPLSMRQHALYREVREIREDLKGRDALKDHDAGHALSARLEQIIARLDDEFPEDWLLRVSLLELSDRVQSQKWRSHLETRLKALGDADAEIKAHIDDGIRAFGVS